MTATRRRLVEGDRVELTVGAVAHGGHCVARPTTGQVVFVRHALPGERVVAEITEVHRGYLRADAVEVLDAVAGPGRRRRARTPGPARCGGCDLQHVAPAAQLRLEGRRRARAARRGWPG